MTHLEQQHRQWCGDAASGYDRQQHGARVEQGHEGEVPLGHCRRLGSNVGLAGR